MDISVSQLQGNVPVTVLKPVLVEYWGGTESGVVTLVDSQEWPAHPGTVGRVLPHWEAFAVDDDGRPLPPGETGAL
jgi:acyl-coenzyme A synthetase/AMP-(fatty) acid ligase